LLVNKFQVTADVQNLHFIVFQRCSFNVEEAGNCVHFIVYDVKESSETPNRGNDSGAITLPNSSRAKPKTDY